MCLTRLIQTFLFPILGWVCQIHLHAEENELISIPKWGLPMVVEGEICMTPGAVIIDTGSSFSSISQEFQANLEELEIRNVREGDAIVRQLPLFTGGTIEINSNAFEGPAYLFDPSPIQLVLGKNVLAILGSSELEKRQILTHHSRGFLQISQQNTHAISNLKNQGTSFTITLINHAPYINIAIGDNIPLKTLIDTGSDGALTLPESTFQDFVERGKITIKGSRRVAVGSGFSEIPYGRLDSFRFCGVTFEDIVVDQKTDSSSIGLEILSRFIWAIDYPNKAAYFFPDPEYSPPFDLQHEFGALLGYLPDGTAKIFQTQKDTPIANAGLKDGDIITRLGDLQTGSFSKEALLEFLSKNSGKEISIKYTRNGMHQVSQLSLPANRETL